MEVTKINSTYGCLEKRVHHEETHFKWTQLTGLVYTKYSIVRVTSDLELESRSKLQGFSQVKMSYLSTIINGREFSKRWTHYKVYTEIGLARVATKFAKECYEMK